MTDRDEDTNSNRGFTSMDKETRERISRKGGEESLKNDDRRSSSSSGGEHSHGGSSSAGRSGCDRTSRLPTTFFRPLHTEENDALMDEHEHAPHCHRDEKGAVAASLRAAILITLLIFAVEVAGGYVSSSLSLLSDAVHMLGDLFALLLSLAAVLLARRLPTSGRTYGYHRAEVLAAFVNGLVLLAVTAGILLSAYDRLRSPPEIEAPIMLGVAVIGLVANLVVIARLHGHSGLGVRSALLHVASDALSSAAVVGAAVVILVTGWTVVDPVLSVLIALLVLASAVRLLRETTAVLLQFTPRGLDLEAVTAAMQEVDGVETVHDVHIWALSTDLYVLDGHVVTNAGEMRQVEAIKTAVKARLRRMGVDHVTLEFESVPCEGCVLAAPDLEPGGGEPHAVI